MAELLTETLGTFQGVNLRRDRLSLRDEDVARAINLDLHTQVGTALLRRGRLRLYGVDDLPARLMRWVGGARYLVSGATLYKNGASLLAALDARQRTTLVAQRPLNAAVTYLFLADESGMQKVSLVDDTVSPWGIAAPTATPALAAGAGPGLSGTYSVSFTYVRKEGTAVAHESNPSPTSADITVTNTVIAVSNLVDSSDTQVTHKRIYRTVNGGSTRLFEAEIAQGLTTANLSLADTALGVAVETDNAVPPVTHWAVRHQEHVFLLDTAHPSYLWWSKRYRPESVPGTNFIDMGTIADPLVCVVSLVGLLGVFTPTTKYRVLGNTTSGFLHQESLSSRGTPAPQAVIVTERGCLFVAMDGLFRTNFVQEDEELSTLISPLFEGRTTNDYLPINFAAAGTMALGYWKQRLYFAYPSGDSLTPDMVAVYSFHTSSWYFYAMDCRCFDVEGGSPDGALLAGTSGGAVVQMETGTVDESGTPIPAELWSAQRALGQSSLQKRFDYARLDISLDAGTVRCSLYIDDRLRQVLVVTPSQVPALLRRLGGYQGYRWDWRLEIAGAAEASVQSLGMSALPLRGT